MREGRSSISDAETYRKIGEHWDDHDLAKRWDETEPVEFVVDIQSEVFYYAVERQLSRKLARAAAERGVSAETLLNMWVQEKLAEGSAQPS
jgi:hypothetical protein